MDTDAAQARKKRQQTKAARDEAKAKYDKTAQTDPARKVLETNWLESEVSFAQAHKDWLVAAGANPEALASAERALDRARGQLLAPPPHLAYSDVGKYATVPALQTVADRKWIVDAHLR